MDLHTSECLLWFMISLHSTSNKCRFSFSHLCEFDISLKNTTKRCKASKKIKKNDTAVSIGLLNDNNVLVTIPDTSNWKDLLDV